MPAFTEAQLLAWITPILWPFLRVLAVFSAAPVLSSRAFPLRAKVGLALLVAFAAQPSLPDQPAVSINGPDALGAVAQQVMVGLAIYVLKNLAAFGLAP